MGQRMNKAATSKRVSANGYQSHITHYQAQRCDGCPLRGSCHQGKTNRIIQVNHRLNELKSKARALLTSQKGIEHRSNRPIEVEAVFGQLKSNNNFERFTMKGMDKVKLEFLLMAIGHNLRKMVTKSRKITPTKFKNGLHLNTKTMLENIVNQTRLKTILITTKIKSRQQINQNLILQ